MKLNHETAQAAGLVGYVIRMTGNYASGGYCADIFCSKHLAPHTKIYTHPAPDDTALLRQVLASLESQMGKGMDIDLIAALRERLGEK